MRLKHQKKNRPHTVTVNYKPLYLAIAALLSNASFANPEDGQVVAGSASFNKQGNTLTITNSNGTIINWKSFSIDTHETTIFNQCQSS